MPNKTKIEINEKFAEALRIMDGSSRHVFITGRAGTGKSTLLELFRSITKKKIVVLAPTGVAALNVRGQTIHSFFGWKPGVTLSKVKKLKPGDERASLYKKLDTVVIDEISMVRADLLDCIDKFMRLNGRSKILPFGGVQVIFIGDLYQLPPVISSAEKAVFAEHYASPYFFSSKVFANEGFDMDFVELEKIYRQQDERFITLLNSVRNNSIANDGLTALNACFNCDFEPLADDFYVYLTATNDQAAVVNDQELKKLPGKLITNTGKMKGKFEQNSCPTEMELKFKGDAQIMLLNNDSSGRWVNGSIAHVLGVERDEDGNMAVIARFSNGEVHYIFEHTWDILNYELDKSTGLIEAEKVGSFTQYPFKLAWAITIHKSQGKTFDKVIIDIGRGSFAHGQMYVALSRATSMQGLVLKKRLVKNHIWMDWRVVDFVTRFQYRKAEEFLPLEKKRELIREAIKNKAILEIAYLKASDVKSTRKIKPKKLGIFEYKGKQFEGVEAECLERKDRRMFKLERILDIKVFSKNI